MEGKKLHILLDFNSLLTDEHRAYLLENGIEVINETPEVEGVDYLLTDNHNQEEVKELVTKFENVEIITTQEDIEWVTFLEKNGKSRIDPTWLDTEIGKNLFLKGLGVAGSLNIEENYPGVFQTIDSLIVLGHLKSGHYQDLIAHKAFHNDFNIINIRNAYNSIIYYLSYLEKELIAGAPFEIEIGLSENYLLLQFSSSVEGFIRDYIYAGINGDKKGLKGSLLIDCYENTDYLDFSYIKETGKIVVSMLWGNNSLELKLRPSMSFNNIHSVKKQNQEIDNYLSQLRVGPIETSQEVNEELTFKALPGQVELAATMAEDYYNYGNDFSKMMEIAIFAKNEILKTTPDYNFDSMTLDELNEVINKYPEEQAVNDLEIRERKRILQYVKSNESLDDFKSLVDSFEQKSTDSKHFKHELENSVAPNVKEALVNSIKVDIDKPSLEDDYILAIIQSEVKETEYLNIKESKDTAYIKGLSKKVSIEVFKKLEIKEMKLLAQILPTLLKGIIGFDFDTKDLLDFQKKIASIIQMNIDDFLLANGGKLNLNTQKTANEKDRINTDADVVNNVTKKIAAGDDVDSVLDEFKDYITGDKENIKKMIEESLKQARNQLLNEFISQNANVLESNSEDGARNMFERQQLVQKLKALSNQNQSLTEMLMDLQSKTELSDTDKTTMLNKIHKLSEETNDVHSQKPLAMECDVEQLKIDLSQSLKEVKSREILIERLEEKYKGEIFLKDQELNKLRARSNNANDESGNNTNPESDNTELKKEKLELERELNATKEEFRQYKKEKEKESSTDNTNVPSGATQSNKDDKKIMALEERSKEIEEKYKTAAKKVKELEHKLKMSQKLMEQAEKKNNKKSGATDPKMKHKLTLLEKNLTRIETEKKKYEKSLGDSRKEVAKLKQDFQASKHKVESLEREVAKYKRQIAELGKNAA